MFVHLSTVNLLHSKKITIYQNHGFVILPSNNRKEHVYSFLGLSKISLVNFPFKIKFSATFTVIFKSKNFTESPKVIKIHNLTLKFQVQSQGIHLLLHQFSHSSHSCCQQHFEEDLDVLDCLSLGERSKERPRQ